MESERYGEAFRHMLDLMETDELVKIFVDGSSINLVNKSWISIELDNLMGEVKGLERKIESLKKKLI